MELSLFPHSSIVWQLKRKCPSHKSILLNSHIAVKPAVLQHNYVAYRQWLFICAQMKLLLGVLVTSLYVQLVTSDWELVWSDEFDGSSIDFTKWSHEITQGGGGVSVGESIN